MASNFSSDSDIENDYFQVKNSYTENQNQDSIYVKRVFSDLQSNLDNVARKSRTNEAEIDEIFDNSINKLNSVRNRVKNELPSLSSKQQEQVVGFWSKAGVFFKKVFHWIKEKFIKLLKIIWQRMKIAAAILDIFSKVSGWIHGIFPNSF